MALDDLFWPAFAGVIILALAGSGYFFFKRK